MNTLKEAQAYLKAKYGNIGGGVFRRPHGSLLPKYSVIIGMAQKGEGNTPAEAMADAERKYADSRIAQVQANALAKKIRREIGMS